MILQTIELLGERYVILREKDCSAEMTAARTREVNGPPCGPDVS
jgi:hypothetical protein